MCSVVVAIAVLAAAGCGRASRQVAAPTITVVASIEPLAQMVTAIGGPTVSVVDLARPGVDPRTAPLSTPQAAQVRRAAVVVEVGGGFQPAVEAAASGAGRVVTVSSKLGRSITDAWLDPVAMQRQAKAVAGAMEAANPPAAGRYANGERDFADQLSSMAINYEGRLGTCARQDIAAPDAALAGVAAQYRLRLHEVGAMTSPDPAQVSRAAAAVAATGITTLFREPWIPAGTVDAVGAATGDRVKTFDTLEAPPAGGWPKGSTYLTLLEANLGTLSAALGCSSDTSS